MCVERLFLGQEPKSIRATRQLEKEGKAEWKSGGRRRDKASPRGRSLPAPLQNWREVNGKLGTAGGEGAGVESTAQSITIWWSTAEGSCFQHTHHRMVGVGTDLWK